MRKLLKTLLITLSIASPLLVKAYTIEDYDLAMKRKDYNHAITVMNDVIHSNAVKTGDYYYKRACAYEKKGDYVYAAIDCGTALRYSADNKDYYLLRARCKRKAGDPTYVDDARKAGPDGLAMLENDKSGSQPRTLADTSTPLKRSGSSDVDINIPVTTFKNKNSFVLIFCIENYLESNISKVDYALNDGKKFKEYCIKTLGIPQQNIHLRADATRNQLRRGIKWAKDISDAYGDDANLIVYYSGHGMPDERSKKSYLLPADGIANDPESGYSLSQFYEELGEMKFNTSLVLLDACFSGSKKDGEMLTKSKGVAIKPDPEALSGNVAVLSATKADDTAYFDLSLIHI